MIPKIIHKREERLSIHFEYDIELINLIKKIPSYKWSQTKKCWQIPNTSENKKILSELLPQNLKL